MDFYGVFDLALKNACVDVKRALLNLTANLRIVPTCHDNMKPVVEMQTFSYVSLTSYYENLAAIRAVYATQKS
jgi:hypothetical protein